MILKSLGLLLCLIFVPFSTSQAQPYKDWPQSHALIMHGQPKYQADFTHLDYVNPQAPKGGTLRQAEIGTFDSLNPFLIFGQAPRTIRSLPLYDPLMRRVWDEPFGLYPLIAERVALAPKRKGVTFFLNPKAQFHDGHAITIEDVLFSFHSLKKHGRPNMRRVYHLVKQVKAHDDQTVTFFFGDGYDQETALILAMMPIFPAHEWQDKDFSKTSLVIPLGSGPYKIASIDAGRQITYERVKDYWAKDLPVNTGHYNFDTLVFDYYRNGDAAMQAFMAGQYDLRREFLAHKWVTNYDFGAVTSGDIIKGEFPHQRTQWARFMTYNTRRPYFRDATVREALSHAFDFDWVNQNLYHGVYQQMTSYFPNSELANTTINFDTSRGVRENLRTAVVLLEKAGWILRDGQMTHKDTGKPLSFEILLDSPSNEKIALAFIRNLQRIGITTTVRTVDSAQYAGRLNDYDFDMIFHLWRNSLSPGTEQMVYWGSKTADMIGGLNYPGAQNPELDQIIRNITKATKRRDLVEWTQKLDEKLMTGWYGIPLYYTDRDYVAYKKTIDHPEKTPLYGPVIETWWSKTSE